MPHVYHHNMKITVEKRKTKKIKANNSDLHLIKVPWVYKPSWIFWQSCEFYQIEVLLKFLHTNEKYIRWDEDDHYNPHQNV
jgi:hypothetical protein